MNQVSVATMPRAAWPRERAATRRAQRRAQSRLGMDASQFEALKRAKELLDIGVLTQDEFNETKLKILRRSDADNDDAEDVAAPTEASKEAALAAAEDALAASLAALNVSAPAALDVGAEVWFKLPDRSIKAGVVIAVSAGAYDLEEDGTGVVRKNYPMKSVKARKPKDEARKENHEKPSLENNEKPPLQNDEKPQIKFAVGKPSKPPPPPAVVAAPAATPPAPPASIPARPRLRVVVDTNVLLDAERLTPAYLLQDCGAVAIVLPTRVVQELDGLKRNDDLGEKARRCNAFLSDQATRRAPWLEFEKAPETRAAGTATADEVILECALAERRSAGRDAVVLATGDRNLQLRAKMADVTALPLPDVRLMAEARDGAWRRAYGHLLPDQNDADRRRAYVRGYGNGA